MSERRSLGALAVLATLASVLQTTVAIPAASANPEPPPTVEGQWLKEAGRLTGSKTTTVRRHKPGKTTDGRVIRRGKHSAEPPVPARWRVEDPATRALIESRLNDGICSRLPDGIIQGPSRCEEYLNNQNPTRPTAEQAVDVIRQNIQRQSVNLPFPKLTVKVQPAGRTLVNLDTIVYTDKQRPTTMQVTLLGYPVTVVGRPASYTWHFGDGTPAVTTKSPGRPYPSTDITHKYLRRGLVKLSVTTNYSAAFNVAGTGWRSIEGTLPVTGPQTSLEVREAVPVLVEPGG